MFIDVIEGRNAQNTWLNAVKFLVKNGEKENELSKEILGLITVIHNPQEDDIHIDELFRKHIGTKWIDKGADTVYPKGGHLAVERWERSYWGRLTKYRNRIDQIGFIIERLQSKPGSKQLSCVTFDPEVDIQPQRPFNPRMPCLISIDFKCRNKKLNLFATFRSHDFGRKAYGNYEGLRRLQNFICQKTGHGMGKIVCYSISAHIRNKELNTVKALLNEEGWEFDNDFQADLGIFLPTKPLNR